MTDRRALARAQAVCDRRRDARARHHHALAPGASAPAATLALVLAIAFLAWAVSRSLL